jgi:hypothetical protein
MTRIGVLTPVGVATKKTVTVPSLPPTLQGRTVGFLDNTKTNFDRLADEIGALLTAEHGVQAVIRRRKSNASTPAPPELLAELAKACDVVFAGSAD